MHPKKRFRGSPRAGLVALVAALALAACHGGDRVDPVMLSDGAYRVVSGSGFPPADEARLLAVTAQLDRSGGRLVLTLADGSQLQLDFTPRPRDAWRQDCYAMSSHASNEVADLSPAPLQVESLTFANPVVFPKCQPGRMILADGTGAEAPPLLVFDHQ